MTPTIRPQVDASEKVQERVEKYAEENGLRMRRAWGDLVKRGLELEGYDQ